MAKLSDVYGAEPIKAVEKTVRVKVDDTPEVALAKALGVGSILLRLEADLMSRIDEEWHRRKLKSRSETIRVLLREALK